MKTRSYSVFTFLLLGSVGFSSLSTHAMGSSPHLPEPTVVAELDLTRYVGLWYEIARFPHRFEDGCVGVTASYAIRPDNRIDVTNRCVKGTLSGPVKEAKGVARVPDLAAPAKLKVRFFWPFEGDYWVLALDAEYRYALVGAPDRDYLWILSRTPTLEDSVFNALVEKAQAQGFDTTRLTRTPQSP